MFFVSLLTQKTNMDRIPFLAFAALLGLSVSAQNAPIDFEPNGHGATWNWKVFENGYNPPLVVVQNPDTNGINTSPNVARFEALQQGQPFVDVNPCTVQILAPLQSIRIITSSASWSIRRPLVM